MDTVKQCLLQLLAKTNIVPADGAPGLEIEREKKERERENLFSITTFVLSFQGCLQGFLQLGI